MAHTQSPHEHHELDHAGDTHHPMHQHHFDTMEQQAEASGFGMWVFLIQEIMFFGGLFVAYLVYRNLYFDAFGAASSTLSIELGAFNTVVLIGSSLTMALGVNAAQMGRRFALMFFIVATMFLGTIFLGVKVIEYTQKFEKREVPGKNFCFEPAGEPCANAVHAAGESAFGTIKRYATGGYGHEPGGDHGAPPAHTSTPAAPQAGEKGGTAEAVGTEEAGRIRPGASDRQRSKPGSEIYFALYFAMTGMHALHMIIGMGIMVWLLYWAWKGLYGPQYYTPIENFGLYWHFVDIVWIYLFPLLYLINRHLGTGAH